MILWACWASSIAWLLEELAPAPQARSVEVERDGHVQLMGGELTADLGDEQFAQVAADHDRASESRCPHGRRIGGSGRSSAS